VRLDQAVGSKHSFYLDAHFVLAQLHCLHHGLLARRL
jgi:hypothetical protein